MRSSLWTVYEYTVSWPAWRLDSMSSSSSAALRASMLRAISRVIGRCPAGQPRSANAASWPLAGLCTSMKLAYLSL